MKKLILLLAVLLSSTLGLAQGIRYQNLVIFSGGYPNPFIRVCTEPTSNTNGQCNTPASIFSDKALTQPLTNPFYGDALGNFFFYANPCSSYHVQITGTGLTAYDIADITLPGCGGGGGSSGTIVLVNGCAVPGLSANFNSTTPAAPTGSQNIQWQRDNNGVTTSVSGYVPLAAPSAAGLVQLANDLSGTSAAPTVVNVHLTSPLGISLGGTGASSAATAFNNLAPPTNAGGLVVGTASNTYGNLPIGNPGQCLFVATATTLGYSSCGASGVQLAPVASQPIVQPVGTNLSVNNFGNIRYATASYNWLQSPATSLSTPGAKTITLTPCPLGIDVSNTAAKPYSVYISTQGTPEAVVVTGGSCTSGGTTGTIIVTTVNAHAAGYTVGSAYGGIQEAVNDASSPNAKVQLLPTGTGANSYQVYSPIILQSNNIFLDGSGATLNCHTRSRCIQIGNLTNANSFGDAHVMHLRLATDQNVASVAITNSVCAVNVATLTAVGHPFVINDWVDVQQTSATFYWGLHQITGTTANTFSYAATGCSQPNIADVGNAALEHAGIEDNVNASLIDDIAFDNPGGITGKFNNGIVVDNDQAAKIEHLNVVSSFRCDAGAYCGAAVYGPGPFATNAGVIWVNNSNISLQCGGNGIRNFDGNSLGLVNDVIQGFSEFGVLNSTAKGGFGGVTMDNVYEELGTCPNPRYTNASCNGGVCNSGAGILSQGGQAVTRGNESPSASTPQFAATSGSTNYNYWIIPTDSVLGTGPPLLAGMASSNQTGNIVVQWPRIAGTNTITYDIVRTTGAGLAAVVPVPGSCAGGTPSACGSVATAQAQCSALVCSFTDTASANTTLYGVVTPTYFPFLSYWPGAVVLSNSQDSQNPIGTAQWFADVYAAPAGNGIISNVGSLNPVAFATRCAPTVNTPIWVSCMYGDSVGNNNPPVLGTLLQNGPVSGGQTPNLKGRLIFEMSPSANIQPGHVITLVDSNPNKTVGDGNKRPTNDANDTFIGLDNGSVAVAAAQLALGAPVAISSYIANVGDNASFLERLTASLKTFKVPITTNSNFTMTGGIFNASLTTGSLPWPVQPGVPDNATCLTTGQAIFQSDAGAGSQVFLCAGNIWTQLTGGGGGGGVNTQLSNLVATAVNQSLVPNAAGSLLLGSAPLPWQKIFLGNGANTTVALTTSAASNQTVTFPNNTGIVGELNFGQTWSATQTFSGGTPGLAFSTARSTSANPAQTGSIQLATTNDIRWRNQTSLTGTLENGTVCAPCLTNTVDLNGLRKDTTDVFKVGDIPGIELLGNITTYPTGTPLAIQPSPATGNNNGANLTLAGGNPAGTGAPGVVLLSTPLAVSMVNSGVTGPIQFGLVSFNSSGQATTTLAGATAGVVGVCMQNCQSGAPNSIVAQIGSVPLFIDNVGAAVGGDYVCISATQTAQGTDCGTLPGSGQVIGNVLSVINAGTGLISMQLNVAGPNPNSVLGNALVQSPAASQKAQSLSSTGVSLQVQCPSGAASTLPCLQILDNLGGNVLSALQNDTIQIGTGVTGTITATGFIGPNANPSQLASAVVRCSDTDTCVSWQNHANSGQVNISKDTSDVITVGGTAGIKLLGPLNATTRTTSNAASLTLTGPTATIDLSTADHFIATLTGNVTVSFSNLAALPLGQIVTFEWCEDGTGSRTLAFAAGPPAIQGTTNINTAATKCTTQFFRTDGTNLVADGFNGAADLQINTLLVKSSTINAPAGVPINIGPSNSSTVANGGMTIGGAAFTNTTAITPNVIAIKGTNNATTSTADAAGNVTVQPGAATAFVLNNGATTVGPNNGFLNLFQYFGKMGTFAAGKAACIDAANAQQVTNCGNNAIIQLGIATSVNGNAVLVQWGGIAATIFVDGAYTPAPGWRACTSATGAGELTLQAGACTAHQQVGILLEGTAGATTAHAAATIPMWIQIE